jgi:poly-beta-1,6-N-acetyl-D-glucosamine synthase
MSHSHSDIKKPEYVLITPAHNEEALIGKTARSVIAQTVKPKRWVIIDDASVDRTSEIIRNFSINHDFIELLNLKRPAGRHYGNKVNAFNLGLAKVMPLTFDFIGNLDADVTFEPDYFENLLRQFEVDEKLGLAGGMIHTRDGVNYISQQVALDSVCGSVQLFRRKCFEDVGGYRPFPNGGIDAAAEIAARMNGWKVRTIPELHVLEHRLTGSATARPLFSRVKEGRRMYSLGYSPLFFTFRCLYRLMERPAIIGSIAALYGYVRSALGGKPVLPSDMVQFLRLEQHNKLKRLLRLKRT